MLTSVCFLTMCGWGGVIGGHLSEEPVELHAFGCGVAALNEARSAIHVHQALVVIVVNGGTEEPDVELLSTGVVHILQETPHPAMNNLCSAITLLWHLDNGPSRAVYEHTGNNLCSK